MSFVVSCVFAFFSGSAALASETLWNRVFINIFGATAFPSMLVLVIFFAGLSFGSALLRRWELIRKKPWHVFAYLEFLSGLCLLPTIALSAWGIYPAAGIESIVLRNTIYVFTACLLIGIPSFFMGGALPALVEISSHQGQGPAGRIGFLYGINTLGGLAGIYAVTFFCIYTLGVRNSLFLCVLLRIGIGITSVSVGRIFKGYRRGAAVLPQSPASLKPPAYLGAVSFLSGVSVLGFEMLLLHAYAQIGQNSAWSFAAMLMLVIAFLGAAALAASWGGYDRREGLRILLPLGAVCLIVFPERFFLLSSGLQNISLAAGSIAAYMRSMVAMGIKSAGAFLFLAGFIFPWVLDIAAQHAASSESETIGLILACNAAGAIAGSIFVEQYLLPAAGLWRSFLFLAFVPLISWVCIECGVRPAPKAAHVLGNLSAVLAVVFFLFQFPEGLAEVSTRKGEEVVDVRAGIDGIVSVCKGSDDLWRMSVDNSFILSTSKSTVSNRRMGHIPLFIHPAPEKVAFIGLATGLTASSAVMHTAVRSVTVLEISPRVIDMSLTYFSPFTGGFERDGRVSIKEADGVHYFASAKESFDVIVGDLFFPWRRGVSRLYSREHFIHVREHLRPGGVFCQWLPADQLDEPALSLIAATFDNVFPQGLLAQVFNGRKWYIGLMGRNDNRPLGDATDRAVWIKRIREESISDTLFLYSDSFEKIFVGPLKEAVPLGVFMHTLDKPLLEKAAVTLEPRLISNSTR